MDSPGASRSCPFASESTSDVERFRFEPLPFCLIAWVRMRVGVGVRREREMLFALAKCPLAFPSSFTTSLPLAVSLIPAVDAAFVCLPVVVHGITLAEPELSRGACLPHAPAIFCLTQVD